MGQLPRVVVWLVDEVAPDEVVPDVVAVVDDAAVLPSLSSSSDRVDAAAVLVCLAVAVAVALAAADVVTVVWPSRHASTPPSESAAATLRTVATLRARAARGGRRVRRRPALCGEVGV
jgi:thiol:disulfide interchange protein